ncbi:MAG TPA: Na+/H+ antiporter subunit E [Myxococcota bacterium]|nr:Na+/H+ antiporter subunit E [Myxococcota bacterium]
MPESPFATALGSRRIAGLALETAGLLAVWLLLTRGDERGLLFGIGFASIVAILRNGLMRPPPLTLRPLAVARFLPYFLWQSLQGGVDIALRAILPAEGPGGRRVFAIEPRLHQYGLRLPPGSARMFFIGVVSLLPGTLSADLEDDTLEVHVIGGSRDVEAQLESLERLVAPLFAVDLRPGADPAARGDGHG